LVFECDWNITKCCTSAASLWERSDASHWGSPWDSLNCSVWSELRPNRTVADELSNATAAVLTCGHATDRMCPLSLSGEQAAHQQHTRDLTRWICLDVIISISIRSTCRLRCSPGPVHYPKMGRKLAMEPIQDVENYCTGLQGTLG
jgi:hypothetical protein